MDLKAKLLKAAIAAVKAEVEDKTPDGDWYGLLESEIDGMLYEPEWSDLAPTYGKSEPDMGCNVHDEITLERLVFAAIKMATKKFHPCDPRAEEM